MIVMFDLLFIVFDSANLSLAFDTLYDVRWSCRNTPGQVEDVSIVCNPPPRYLHTFTDNPQAQGTDDPLCDRQRALAAFLFLALCAWIATFMISVFRCDPLPVPFLRLPF